MSLKNVRYIPPHHSSVFIWNQLEIRLLSNAIKFQVFFVGSRGRFKLHRPLISVHYTAIIAFNSPNCQSPTELCRLNIRSNMPTGGAYRRDRRRYYEMCSFFARGVRAIVYLHFFTYILFSTIIRRDLLCREMHFHFFGVTYVYVNICQAIDIL